MSFLWKNCRANICLYKQPTCPLRSVEAIKIGTILFRSYYFILSSERTKMNTKTSKHQNRGKKIKKGRYFLSLKIEIHSKMQNKTILQNPRKILFPDSFELLKSSPEYRTLLLADWKTRVQAQIGSDIFVGISL